jgi:hypothetical protein
LRRGDDAEGTGNPAERALGTAGGTGREAAARGEGAGRNENLAFSGLDKPSIHGL